MKTRLLHPSFFTDIEKRLGLPPRVTNELGPTRLYRLYNTRDALLYVGVTWNLEYRLKQHCYYKHWWTEVARVGVEVYANPRACLAAERAAIRDEDPRYNFHRKRAA